MNYIACARGRDAGPANGRENKPPHGPAPARVTPLGGGPCAQKTKSGQGGIRTHVAHEGQTGFRDRRVQPLRHLSEGKTAFTAPPERVAAAPIIASTANRGQFRVRSRAIAWIDGRQTRGIGARAPYKAGHAVRSASQAGPAAGSASDPCPRFRQATRDRRRSRAKRPDYEALPGGASSDRPARGSSCRCPLRASKAPTE
jgi:hypothetical protein